MHRLIANMTGFNFSFVSYQKILTTNVNTKEFSLNRLFAFENDGLPFQSTFYQLYLRVAIHCYALFLDIASAYQLERV